MTSHAYHETMGPRGTRQYHVSQQAFVTAGEDLLAPPSTACGQIVGKRNRALISPLRYRLRTQTWTSARDSERLHGYKKHWVSSPVERQIIRGTEKFNMKEGLVNPQIAI
jgi:hypothetical protein